MSMIGRLWSGLKGYYNEINPATLSGAIDVIAIQLEDGSFVSTPFHVRFGKAGILRPREKVVDIYVNKQFVPQISMKIGEAGEGYFVDEDDFETSLRQNPKPDLRLPESPNVESDLFPLDTDDLGLEQAKNLTHLGDPWQLDDSRVHRCLSDSEMERHDEDQAPEMEWTWGEMPVVKRHARVDEDGVAPRACASVASTRRLYRRESMSDSALNVRGDIECDTAEIVAKVLEMESTNVPEANYQRTSTCSPANSLAEESGYRSDSDSLPLPNKDFFTLGEVRMSLCGGLDQASYKPSLERFMQHLITYEEFAQDPVSILANDDLVVQIGGKFYPWKAAAPQLMSMTAFKTPLAERSLSKLVPQKNPNSSRRGGVRSWFRWGRRTDVTNSDSESRLDTDAPLSSSMPERASSASPPASRPLLSPAVDMLKRSEAASVPSSPPRQDWFSDTELEQNSEEVRRLQLAKPRRTRLTSEEMAKLNLVEGRNEIVYSVTTQFQGTTRCSCYIYLWKWWDKIVVSDIDGTITKSDVWGHIYTLMGRDWTQVGVCKLYRTIERNGYRFVYLSSRAIGQATLTRDYLTRIRQDGDLTLPVGPVLLNPSSLLHAFHKEVIQRRPEEFKIRCLDDVRSLFPKGCNPLYAGFGNRLSDTTAYLDVGIETRRCFTVNHRGELKNETCEYIPSSYTALSEIVDLYFPPVDKLTGAEAFADNCYWSVPVPRLSLPGDEEAEFDELDFRQSYASW